MEEEEGLTINNKKIENTVADETADEIESAESVETATAADDEHEEQPTSSSATNIDKNIENVVADPVNPTTPLASSFRDCGVAPWLVKQLEELNLRRPTAVQSHCIPRVLDGADVLGCAKTGTGKTLAFALPILQKLAIDPFGVFALILTPTRELAFQIGDQFEALGRQLSLRCAVIVGGRHQMAQAQELCRRPHIVVATPGRLADHIQSEPAGIASLLRTIRFLVLDEADRLLDGQYALQLKTVFESVPKQRQTLLFSATLTDALNKLHQVSVRKPYFFEEHEDTRTVEELEQRYVLCPRAVKDAYLVYVVKEFYTSRDGSSIIVFAKTCRECQALALMFKKLGYEVGSLHSEILQSKRTASLTKFRSGRIRILICTDVAARGLDIPHVDLVVNHNVPRCPKTYVHRVGRSARAGRFGAAVSFVTQYDLVLLKAVEELIGKKLTQLEVPHSEVALYAGRVLATKREAEIRLERQEGGGNERKECWKRKELALQGLGEEAIERVIQRWKKRQQGKGNNSNDEKKAKKGKKKLNNANAKFSGKKRRRRERKSDENNDEEEQQNTVATANE